MTTYTGYRRTTRRDDPSERLGSTAAPRLPCRRCGTPIQVKAQGRDARLTYWCPKCQDDSWAVRLDRSGSGDRVRSSGSVEAEAD